MTIRFKTEFEFAPADTIVQIVKAILAPAGAVLGLVSAVPRRIAEADDHDGNEYDFAETTRSRRRRDR